MTFDSKALRGSGRQGPAALVAAAILLVPPTAGAAERADPARLHLSPFGGGLVLRGFDAEAPWRLQLVAHYERGPVVVRKADGARVGALLSDRLTGELLGAARVLPWLELGARLPVVVQDGDLDGAVVGLPAGTLGGAGVGNPEIAARARLSHVESVGVDTWLVAAATLPIGGGADGIGEDGVGFHPAIAFARPLGSAFTAGAEVGYRFRGQRDGWPGFEAADEVTLAAGLGYRGATGPGLQAELFGAVPTEGDQSTALEALVAATLPLGAGLEARVGGGAGLTDTFGTPSLRALAGLAWAPAPVAARAVAPQPLPPPQVEQRPASQPPAQQVEQLPPPTQQVEELPAPQPPAPARQPEPQVAPPRIEPVRFASGGAAPEAASQPRLATLARVLVEEPAFVVVLEGHTDAVGSPALNQRLSEQRAAAVRDALVRAGVEPARIEVRGVAATRPLADNGSAAGRAQNRRVEIRIERR